MSLSSERAYYFLLAGMGPAAGFLDLGVPVFVSGHYLPIKHCQPVAVRK